MNRLKAWPQSISAILHSVRFRLAAWFALALAVVLLTFSVFVYTRTAQDMRSQVAGRLIARLTDMNNRLRLLTGFPFAPDWWLPGDQDTDPFILQENEVALLSDPQGRLAETWGSISAEETSGITRELVEQAFSNKAERSGNLLFTFPLEQRGPGGDQAVTYLFATAPILYNNHMWGWIILGLPIDPEGHLPRLVWTLLLAGSLTLVIALAGAFWLADRSLWPVKTITRTAREISETDLSRRLNIHTRDELGELAGTFDRMLDRLQAAFDRQRQFTADASHELRTPLTVIGLETDRALEGKRTAEDYHAALEVIHSENAFMTRLVNELLTLARMDAGQVNLDRQPLDLSDVTLEVAERFEKLAANQGIRLEVGDLPELRILGDRQYLAQMIGNLVDNAIKYSPQNKAGQWVRLETGSDPAGNACTAWVKVSDNGAGIAAEHLPHLFDRFYRVDQARSHNPGESSQDADIPGSGLGLSIVQWIAHMHGGQVIVQSTPGQGSTFEVRLPGIADGQTSREQP